MVGGCRAGWGVGKGEALALADKEGGIKVQRRASWLSGKSPVQSSVVSRLWIDPGGRGH